MYIISIITVINFAVGALSDLGEEEPHAKMADKPSVRKAN